MKRMMLAAAVALVALTVVPVGAQSTTGTISGRVVDPQGLSVPGVTVIATSPALQGSRDTVSTGNGSRSSATRTSC